MPCGILFGSQYKRYSIKIFLNNHACFIILYKGSSPDERMQSILNELKQHISLEECCNKVVVVKGDLSRPNLGLNEDDYMMICNSADVIIHNGAVVNAALPYEGNQ